MDLNALMAAMEITAAAAEKPIAVEVAGWGTVYVRGLTAADMDDQLADESDPKNKRLVARGVVRLMCDETGKRNWDANDDKQVALMARQPWSILRKLSSAIEEVPPEKKA